MWIKKSWLINNEIANGCSIEDKIIDTGRWTTHHEVIFEKDSKFYRTYYSRGATEMQPEEPFENDGAEIDCTEVRQVSRMMKVWKAVPVVTKKS